MRRLLPESLPKVDSNILGEDSVTILPPSMCLLAPYLVKASLYDTKHVNFTCMGGHDRAGQEFSGISAVHESRSKMTEISAQTRQRRFTSGMFEAMNKVCQIL